MKFACDRCKTRYSIADERVRGKILKIRCKNCANVITVREGGEAELAAADEASPAPARGGAAPLQAAFASAMAAPAAAAAPAALEEEWYVSLDGVQHGPLSLAQAQAWIRAKPHDADLHCWCEGFDDWLPVDKVSHFRGLRRPPPRPPTSVPVAAPPPRAPEPEPEPLFAATMAALEADAATRQPRLESPTSAALTSPSAPVGGGGWAPSAPAGRTPLPAPLPLPGGPGAAGGAKAPTSSIGGALGLRAPASAQGTGPAAVARTPVPAPLGPSTGPSAFAGEPPTMITGAPPDLEAAPEPGPAPSNGSNGNGRNGHAVAAPAGGFDDLFDGRSKPMPGSAAADASATDDDSDDDDGGLSIGEVSRVVNLADLARQANRPKPAAARAPTAAVPALRGTGAVPSLGPGMGGTGAMPSLGGGFGATGAMPVPPGMGGPGMMPGGPGMMMPTPAPAPAKHHHVLWAVVAVVLLGLVGVVLLVQGQGGDGTGPRIAVGDDDDLGMQIDDPRRPRVGSGAPPGAGSGSSGGGLTSKFVPGIRRPGGGGNNGSDGPAVKPGGELDASGQPRTDLRPDEVSDVANKLSMGRQRCYEQALKKDPFLDVKKIAATIKIDRAGVVTDVTLSSHADHTLGVCLIAAIKRWKLRESTSGITTQMSFAFVQ